MAISLISEALLDELAQRGQATYHNKLKTFLEAEHRNDYAVIHVDKGDYAIAKSCTLANREMLARHSADGRLFGRKIGSEPRNDFVSRMAVMEASHRER